MALLAFTLFPEAVLPIKNPHPLPAVLLEGAPLPRNKLLMEGRIIHGGNPVLRWMAGNVVIDTDPAGNIKVTKAKSKEKIDGIVAAIMALDRCIRQEGQSGSVYDERGLLVF